MNEPTQSAATTTKNMSDSPEFEYMIGPVSGVPMRRPVGSNEKWDAYTLREPTQSAARVSELLPCPFGCDVIHKAATPGIHAVSVSTWAVGCPVCGCEGGSHTTQLHAIKAWNTRALPTPASVPPSEAALEWLRCKLIGLHHAPEKQWAAEINAFTSDKRETAAWPSEAVEWLEGAIGSADVFNFNELEVGFLKQILTFLETAALPASIEAERSPQTNGGSIETSAFKLAVIDLLASIQCAPGYEGNPPSMMEAVKSVYDKMP